MKLKDFLNEWGLDDIYLEMDRLGREIDELKALASALQKDLYTAGEEEKDSVEHELDKIDGRIQEAEQQLKQLEVDANEMESEERERDADDRYDDFRGF